MNTVRYLTCLVPLALLAALPAYGQTMVEPPIIILPQRRIIAPPDQRQVRITGVDADIRIREQVATTSLTVKLHNPSRHRLEAELMLPVPDASAIRSLHYSGLGDEPSGKILPREEARRIYNDIVARMKDPALLEFIGLNLLRTSVFPIEPGDNQTVTIVYENLLRADGQRIDYILPRTEAVDYNVPWTIKVTVESTRAISTVYSPSHALRTTSRGDHRVVLETEPNARTQPGSFRLSYLLEADDITATLLAYPDPKVGGGYFLLLAGLPAPNPDAATPSIQREVTLVLDRSGSMGGAKIDQVREAAKQIIAGLSEGETFNIIIYNDTVERFSPQSVVKSRETETAARAYLDTVTAQGGTNIHDALVEAIRTQPSEGMLPIVLFLTDGLPTVGQTSEQAISGAVEKGNKHERRIFTFGVGNDVNTPLLMKIATATRASSTFVLPDENVEVKVGSLFRRLTGPVMASPTLNAPANRVRDVLPGTLPDLFEGDQLVVLGQYMDDAALTFTLEGNFRGEGRTFTFEFSLDDATTANSFVPRLWASRKIGVMLDAMRDLGADPSRPVDRDDPRVKELVDEIIRLSTEFGILTEYTAFLAREDQPVALSQPTAMREAVAGSLGDTIVRQRSGADAVRYARNDAGRANQAQLNAANTYVADDGMEREITTVQQVGNSAMFRRGNRWVDGRTAQRGEDIQPDRVVQIGTDDFERVVDQLVIENRQSVLAMGAEVLIELQGETVLIQMVRN
jgi:Ca-activated chloride channel family protein